MISFFNKGRSISWVCPFHFYGICNEQESDSTCVYGKISQVLTNLIFVRYSQCITAKLDCLGIWIQETPVNRIYCHETFDIGRDEGMVVNREYEDRGRFEFMKGYLHGMVFKYRTKSILKSQKWIYAATGIRIKHYEEIDMTITVMNLATTKETPRRWKGLNCAKQAVIIIACAAFLALSAGSAVAAEGGSSFYLLGQRGQGAAVCRRWKGYFLRCPPITTAATLPV